MSNEIQKLERELENAKGELIKVQNQSQDKDNVLICSINKYIVLIFIFIYKSLIYLL